MTAIDQYVSDLRNPNVSSGQALATLQNAAIGSDTLIGSSLADTLLGGVSTIAGKGAVAAGSPSYLDKFKAGLENVGISSILFIAGGALVLFGIYAIVNPSKDFIIKQVT